MFLVSGQKSTGPAVLETSQLQMGQMDPNGGNCKVCFHIRNSSYISINERRICRYRRCHFLLAVCGFGSEPLFPFQEPNQHLLLPNHTQPYANYGSIGRPWTWNNPRVVTKYGPGPRGAASSINSIAPFFSTTRQVGYCSWVLGAPAWLSKTGGLDVLRSHPPLTATSDS